MTRDRTAARAGVPAALLAALAAGAALVGTPAGSSDDRPAAAAAAFASRDGDPAAAPPTRSDEYTIRARLIVLGDLGPVGRMIIEQWIDGSGPESLKAVRVAGGTWPGSARGNEYQGEFRISRPDGTAPPGPGGALAPSGGDYFGRLVRNGRSASERVFIYPDRVETLRGDGRRLRLDGAYESPFAALQRVLASEVRPSDAGEGTFFLDGRPHLFRWEAGPETFLKRQGARAFPVDVMTWDAREAGAGGRPRALRRKGDIRVWVCKGGPLAGSVVRIALRLRWYLTLSVERAADAGAGRVAPRSRPL